MLELRHKLDNLFYFHAIVAIVSGSLFIFLPHSFLSSLIGMKEYGHLVHEVTRLYGVLVLAQGWLVWQTRKVSDALIRRTFCQAYCLCFSLQTLVVLKAQISSPESHSFLNWINILILSFLAFSYGYFLLLKPIKVFELPGARKCDY